MGTSLDGTGQYGYESPCGVMRFVFRPPLAANEQSYESPCGVMRLWLRGKTHDAALLRIPMWGYELADQVRLRFMPASYESPCGVMRKPSQAEPVGYPCVTNPHVGL